MPQLRRLQDGIAARILAALSASQTARFRQIVLQAEGIWAALIPEVTRELGLSAAQKQKIRSMRASVGKKMQALQRMRQLEIEAIPAPRDSKNKAAVESYRSSVIALMNRNRGRDQKEVRAWGRGAMTSASAVLTRTSAPRGIACWGRNSIRGRGQEVHGRYPN